jgi:hypothetical protein
VVALANVGQLLNLSSKETHDAAGAPFLLRGQRWGCRVVKRSVVKVSVAWLPILPGGSGSAFVMRNSSGQVGSRCEWTGTIESEAKTAAGAQRGIFLYREIKLMFMILYIIEQDENIKIASGAVQVH